MQPELDEKRFGMIPRRRVQDFYRAYHTYLKSNGIDGVKVCHCHAVMLSITLFTYGRPHLCVAHSMPARQIEIYVVLDHGDYALSWHSVEAHPSHGLR